MYKSIAFFFVVISFSSCISEPLNYSDELIEFNLPAGWKLKDVDSPTNEVTIYTINTGRFSNDGLISISVYENLIDHNYLVNFNRKVLKETNFNVFSVKADFEENKEDTFGTYNSIFTEYKMKTLGMKFKGQIHSFSGDERTALIIFQDLKGKKDVYEKSIESLKSSFKFN